MSSNSKRAGEIAGRMMKERADRHAESLLPVLTEARKSGGLTYEEMASYLTCKDIPTPRGNKVWNVRQVQTLLTRLIRLGLAP